MANVPYSQQQDQQQQQQPNNSFIPLMLQMLRDRNQMQQPTDYQAPETPYPVQQSQAPAVQAAPQQRNVGYGQTHPSQMGQDFSRLIGAIGKGGRNGQR